MRALLLVVGHGTAVISEQIEADESSFILNLRVMEVNASFFFGFHGRCCSGLFLLCFCILPPFPRPPHLSGPLLA